MFKKSIMGLLAVCFMMLSMLQVTQAAALSQQQLNDKRWEMQHTLDNTPFVSYDKLYEKFGANYTGQSTRFNGTCIGTNESGEAIFEDYLGNRFQVVVTSYQLKVGTKYVISAVFESIFEDSKGIRSAVFTYENAHMPYLSEYGL